MTKCANDVKKICRVLLEPSVFCKFAGNIKLRSCLIYIVKFFIGQDWNVLLFSRGRVAGYVTGRKKKTGNFEHRKQRNNGFQYSKNFF